MSDSFSVGMAVYDRNFHGTYPETPRVAFTVQSLLLHHPLVGEVVVVDNNPDSNSTLPKFLAKCGKKVRYVPMPEPQGTSPPRNRVFEEARHENVVCIDPHVLLYPGTLEALAGFYDTHRDCTRDVLHGFMMGEGDTLHATHMNDQWRAEMLGTWGIAYHKKVPVPYDDYGYLPRESLLFSVLTRDDKNAEYVDLTTGEDGLVEQRPLTEDFIRQYKLPYPLSWPGHEKVLFAAGCEVPDRPFKVPGHGMGFFACKKSAWLELPFHPEARGFGGEEITTGYRFRKGGRNCWSVPRAKWWHHYERPSGVPYPLTLWNKVRNYVIEFRRLGLPLDPIRQHFPASKFNEPEWQQLVAGANWPDKPIGINPATIAPRPRDMPPDTRAVEIIRPVERSNASGGPEPYQTPQNATADHPVQNKRGGCGFTGESAAELASRSLDLLYEQLHTGRTNISADAAVLKGLAAKCDPDTDGPGIVVELGTHQGNGTTALLAGRPKMLVTYGQGPDEPPRIRQLKEMVPEGTLGFVFGPDYDAAGRGIPNCDLLFVNTEPHSADRVRAELDHHRDRCRRYVALHGTTVYGQSYNGGPGILPAVKAFLADNPDWHAVGHYPTPSGLTVLSRKPGDTHAQLPVPRPVNGAAAPARPAVGPPPGHGPGTELKRWLESIGVVEKPNCDCTAKMQLMDRWSVDGCRTNYWTCVGWMKDGAKNWGWEDKAGAAWKILKKDKSWAWKFLVKDHWAVIIDEMILRAVRDEVK